jgi:hypothetical protein
VLEKEARESMEGDVAESPMQYGKKAGYPEAGDDTSGTSEEANRPRITAPVHPRFEPSNSDPVRRSGCKASSDGAYLILI